ncbi:hypothetical protein ABG067_002318 [Albugo candida]
MRENVILDTESGSFQSDTSFCVATSNRKRLRQYDTLESSENASSDSDVEFLSSSKCCPAVIIGNQLEKETKKATSRKSETFDDDVECNITTTSNGISMDCLATDVSKTTELVSVTDSQTTTPLMYASLATLLNQIEKDTSRLVIQDRTTSFYRNLIEKSPQDLVPCIYLCLGTDLAPPYENIKIGVGDAILMKAIGEATGTSLKFVKEMYQKEGDLGQVAQKARCKQNTLQGFTSNTRQKNAFLSVSDVYSQFKKIAMLAGNQSQQQKCTMIKYLLVKCQNEGEKDQSEAAKFIIRGLQGKLRIGLAEKSIVTALTYAFMKESERSDRQKQQMALTYVKKAFAERPSFDALVEAFFHVQKERSSLWLKTPRDFESIASRCILTPGTPIAPMLARPTKTYSMVFDRFQGKPFTCEYKYDGERAQIHLESRAQQKVCIFSRNFENTTERFPDVRSKFLDAISGSETLKNCIIDAEIVAIDRTTRKRLPFQVLSTRSRKNVRIEDIKVAVCVYAFDLLYLNGESLLSKPLRQRREKLHALFQPQDGSFEYVQCMDVTDTMHDNDSDALEEAIGQIRSFLEKATDEHCEGLMVKTLDEDATYEPANRSHKWLKVKKDYLDGIGDSTDLIPIGAFHGRGKRTGVYGAYLLACYDPDVDMYQCITKLGTGLSDEMLKDLHAQLQSKKVEQIPREYVVTDNIKPDVWFEPSCVWEILGADLSISPKYTAAMGLIARDKGISLRFPRFIRARDDKKPTEATTAAQIADLYRAQGLATVSAEIDADDDDYLI